MTEKDDLTSIQDVKALVERVQEARLQELHSMTQMADARAAVEREGAVIVQAAYDAGEINTKNKDTRDAGEADVLARHKKYQDHVAVAKAYEKAAAQAKIERQCLEDEVALTKAWLYSQTRIR